jgi:hypothetical protein
MASPSIAVLGGGVSGITAGLTVALLGGRPHLYTTHRADTAWGTHRPQMASLYPAASVIPHRVAVGDVAAHMRDTQACFEVLRQSATCGVRLQSHYEVFEAPPEGPPAYADAVHNFRMLPADGSGRPPMPWRPGAPAVFGWTFRTYFAETPTYLPRLFELFRALGGQVAEQHISQDTLTDLPGDALINALGAGARSVFPDSRPAHFLRGCLVYATPPSPVRMPGSEPLASYNYTPRATVYPTADGEPGGLYLYPRLDAWVLGGSARSGTLMDDGTWSGPPIEAPTLAVDGLEVPRPVLSANADIIEAWTGADVRTWPLRATFGIRYARDLDGDGVRLDTSRADGRLVAHCYGHGGAGVTLSWSSALRVARHLRRHDCLPERLPPLPDTLSAPDAVLLRMLRRVLRDRL